MVLATDRKDFLLHLYDKLWENMAAKESRLWNYLALYGAAVSLALGASHFGAAELITALVVLALTVWALLIVINANWWYQRNHLMVTQIEKVFATDGGLDGVVPKTYRDARFGFDRLYRGSVLVLSFLAFLFYTRAMWLHRAPVPVPSRMEVAVLGGMYVLTALAIMYCSGQHISYVVSFYSTKKDLLLEADPAADVSGLAGEEKEARARFGWDFQAGAALVAIMAVFDLMPGRQALSAHCWVASAGVLMQVASIVLFFAITRHASLKPSLLVYSLRILLLLALAGSAVVFLHR